MKSFTLALAGTSETFELQVPTSWADVTLAQYLRLRADPDTPRLCILTELAPEQLHQLPDSDGDILYRRLEFVDDVSDLLTREPTTPRWPSGIAMHGQVNLMEQFIEENPAKHDLFYAPYLYALSHSNWRDPAALQACYESVLQQPVLEVYADVMQALVESQAPDAPDDPTMTRLRIVIGTDKKGNQKTMDFKEYMELQEKGQPQPTRWQQWKDKLRSISSPI